MIYFISDTHFGHRSALSRSTRPFATVEARDERIIDNWNARVKRGDTVYILGDLVCKSDKGARYYLERLNGKKILIAGNHDVSWCDEHDMAGYFVKISRYEELFLDGRCITLCHYPMLEWRNSRKLGSDRLGYLIYGHTHIRADDKYRPLLEIGNALNACVDINNYAPATFEELRVNNEAFKLSVLKRPVDKAMYLCRAYHMHQRDKAGISYAEHPIFVSSLLESETDKIVALLHDTLEDTNISPSLIEAQFGEEVLGAIEAMTHREGEEYFEYLDRVCENPISRRVKIADITHNMDLSRLREVSPEDIQRVEKYRCALERLKAR